VIDVHRLTQIYDPLAHVTDPLLMLVQFFE
jgi:hypothetical protein